LISTTVQILSWLHLSSVGKILLGTLGTVLGELG